VIGRIDAAAAMQRMTSANVGEKPTPSALSSNAFPSARVVQQPKRKPPAANVERVTAALSLTRVQIACRRSERLINGSRSSRGPAVSAPMHPRQKRSTTIRGARKIAPDVVIAAIASGNIATASTRPSEMIDRMIASRPSFTPPSRRIIETLTT
jgi:hypothetical protein